MKLYLDQGNRTLAVKTDDSISLGPGSLGDSDRCLELVLMIRAAGLELRQSGLHLTSIARLPQCPNQLVRIVRESVELQRGVCGSW